MSRSLQNFGSWGCELGGISSRRPGFPGSEPAFFSFLSALLCCLKRISSSLTHHLLSYSAGKMLPMDDNLRVDEDQVCGIGHLSCTATSMPRSILPSSRRDLSDT